MVSDTISYQPDGAVIASGACHVIAIASGVQRGLFQDLPLGHCVTVGRGMDADLRVDDPRLSRRHARFEAHADHLRVVDLGSHNGTWLRGARVHEAALRSGESVSLAGVQVYVHSTRAAASGQAPGTRAARPRPAVARATPLPERQPRLLASARSEELQRMLERIAPRSISVLIVGETGTGKELIAQELHALSTRRERPFRVLNCAAIPQSLIESVLFGHVKGAFTGADRDRAGVFQEADGGTVFLDEVGELSREAQAALLRALETRRVCPIGTTNEISTDVRVVAATHRDLSAMCSRGEFRLDLYHRLNGVLLEIPPLRARREEILPLAEHFLGLAGEAEHGAAFSLCPDARALLSLYDWPGNVRELRNVIERGVALCDDRTIRVRDLPAAVQSTRAPSTRAATSDFARPELVDLRGKLQQHEAQLIREALRQSFGNQRQAAALLRLPLRTFERKLRSLRLDS